MATSRILVLLALLHFSVTSVLLACGGGYDEEPSPTLDLLLKGFPAKSISSVLQDQGIVVSNGNETVVVPDELKKDFLQGPSAQLTRKIDELLIAARVARSSAADLNLLQDLKDLSVGHASAQEAGGYVDWRLAHRDWFMKPEVLPSWERPKVDTNAVGVLDQKIADSSEALRPHWIYLKGAYYYNKGNDTESQQCFDRILKDYPSDPRAETTFFMKGRCLLSQSVGNKETPDAAMLDEAKAQFEHYLQRYPKGRYLNDVLGWLGGAAYRSGREQGSSGGSASGCCHDRKVFLPRMRSRR